MPKIYLWCAVVLLAAITAGCGADKAVDTTVAVNGTDTKCDVADTSLSAGTIRFEFTNSAKLTNELYVLGDKGRVIKEVENILPGGKSHLDVSLKAGTYTLACKPGQTGDGIRQRITVTGVGGTAGAAGAKADRTIAVAAKEYA